MDPAFVEYVLGDQRRLHAIAYTLTGNREDAQDLVQETLLRVGQAWSRIDARGPHPYAATVLYRLARRRRSLRRVALEVIGEEPYSAVDDRLLLRACVLELAPRQRAVIALRYLCDMSERETAEVMGCSIGTVKSQSSKALRILAVRMDIRRDRGATGVSPRNGDQ